MTLNDPGFQSNDGFPMPSATCCIPYPVFSQMFSDVDDWNVEDELSLDFSFLATPEKKKRSSLVNFENKMTYDGFSYSKKSTASTGEHAFYQCPSYRAPHFCKASIKYTCHGAIVERNVVHTCSQKGTTKEVEVGKINDVTAEMKQMILDSCIDDATKSATDVAKHVFDCTLKKYEGISMQMNNADFYF